MDEAVCSPCICKQPVLNAIMPKLGLQCGTCTCIKVCVGVEPLHIVLLMEGRGEVM